jgi:hypothetical protein
VPIWTEQHYLNTKKSRDGYVALVAKDLRQDTIAPSHGWPADSAFRSSDPYGGSKNGEWTYRDQAHFDELWTPEGDEIANELADRYAFGWPYLIARSLATSAPMTCRSLMELATREDRPNFDLPDVPEAMFDHIVMWGSFHAVRKRRTWPEPTTVRCPICGREFWNGYITHWMYRSYGPARYCNDCCSDARTGHTETLTGPKVIKALTDLATAFDAIPGSSFAFNAFPADASDEKRDQWMRALTAVPAADRIKEILGCKDWLGVLKVAGLVTDGWKMKRGGVMSHAVDGHLCRSLLERTIDDWLTGQGIKHEREPRWPYDPVLNRNGMRRADWLVPDGSFIECAGMMSRPEYALKMAEKQELARLAGIKLHIVTPEDMLRLDKIFGYIA